MAETTGPHFRLKIRQDKCDGCSSRAIPVCTEVCPHGAIYPDINSNYIWVDCDLSRNRDLCQKCVDACPRQAIQIRRVPSPRINERTVTYFESPGIQDTKPVVDVIANRVAEGNIKAIVIASCSGSSALLVAQALRDYSVKIINISAPTKAWEEIRWRPISKEMVRRLSELGVICREKHCVDEKQLTSFPEALPFYDWRTGREYKIQHLENVVWDTLIHVGGMGLKTSVECVFSACTYGDVAIGENVIGTAGSGWGLDTAVVIRATTPEKCFSRKPAERLEIREILAMPSRKRRWG